MNYHPAQDTAPESVAKRVQAAIQVAKAGDKFTARRMLLDIVEMDPTQEDVWLWLAGLSEDLEEAKTYLETVLALNPTHVRAAAGLRIVEQRLASNPAPAAAQVANVASPPRVRICETCGHRIPDELDTCPTCTRVTPASRVEKEVAGISGEGGATVDVQQPVASAPFDTTRTAPPAVDVSAEIAPSFTLSVEQAEAIDACLERMAYESEASCIILADVTGQLISERGKTVGMNTQVLSALAAGELSATQEMARLVGERARFSLLLHEGEERSVYLSPVGMKMLLIVVFDGRTPIGLVRIILKNAVEELGPILERPAVHRSDESLGQALSGDFAQQLQDEFDASLDMLTG